MSSPVTAVKTAAIPVSTPGSVRSFASYPVLPKQHLEFGYEHLREILHLNRFVPAFHTA